ncbi:hypothetical protein [Streptomyces sannanensis]|uniref:hypothetical protein n=1 Tax=Streptomyces sannanensis TaxID=285536 RepID=UPI0031F1BCF3
MTAERLEVSNVEPGDADVTAADVVSPTAAAGRTAPRAQAAASTTVTAQAMVFFTGELLGVLEPTRERVPAE